MEHNEIRISDLKIQHLENPVGIGASKPLFSYLLHSDRKDVRQSAWQILAASTPEKLDQNLGDLWDSGKRKGSRNFGIVYEGIALESRQRVFWKVKVWDEKDQESEWSSMAYWEMGLLKEADWKGCWIGQGDMFQGEKATAPMLCRDFVLQQEKIGSARLYISGLGIFKAYINGKSVAETFFDPGESDAEKTVYYVVYDVTGLMQPGNNTLGVLLGNGQYTGYTVNPVMTDPTGTELPRHRYQKNDGFVKAGICGEKKLLAQLEVVFESGMRRIAVVTDEGWVWKESAVVFQNWYGGEDYDATVDMDDWNCPTMDRRNWNKAEKMVSPGGVLRAREFQPVRIMERLKPREIKRLSNGNWLVDMGRNGAGFPELMLDDTDGSLRGRWIKMYPAELLKADGEGVNQASCTQSQNERYHCSIMNAYRIAGKGKESWHPLFCYQGFRYVEVEGYPGELTAENIRYCILRTDNEKNGYFYSSSNVLNQINRMVENSMESNMFSSFTDCPQIEKLGWIETSHLMFRSLAGTYDISSWMRKIIHDIADSQVVKEGCRHDEEEAGYVPAIVPEYQRIIGLHRDPNWGGACVFTPWEYYLYYGEYSILEEAYPVMKKYILYLQQHLKGGVLEDYAQMGEWGQLKEETPTVLVATCAFFRMLMIAAQIARLLCRDSDVEFFLRLAEDVRVAFHCYPACYDPEKGIYGNGSQASYGCAVFSGMVPDEKKADVVEYLVEAVKERDYHFSCGEVGVKQVLSVLAEYGRNDVISRMVMNETAPSYRFFADAGFTTLPEYWNPDEPWYGMARSRNHAMMGHVKEWFTYHVLGLKPLTPAFEKMVIRPYIMHGIKRLHGYVICPYGKVEVDYTEDIEGTELKVSLPVGTWASVWEPEREGEESTKRLLAQIGSGCFCWKKESGKGFVRG